MALTILKELLASTDINWDTPGHGGAAPTNMTRTASDGSTSSQPRPSAFQIGVIDAPVVAGTGALGSFQGISPTTDKTIENCIRELALKGLAAYSFEGYGGEAGVGIPLDNAKRNTAVWSAIADDAGTSGAVIFMPAKGYEFALDATLGGLFATHILPWDSAGGLILVGGGNTVIRANAGSSVPSGSLFHVGIHPSAPVDVNNVVISDITFDNSLGGEEVDISTTTAETINDVHVFRVKTANTAMQFQNTGSSTCKRLLVANCNMQGVGTFLVEGYDTAVVRDNFLVHGMKVKTNSNSRILDNAVTDIGDLEIEDSNDVISDNNSLSKGEILVLNTDELTLSKNQMFRGSIKYTTGAAGNFKVYAIDNQVNALGGDESYGINIVASKSLNDLVVSRNHITGADEHGLYVVSTDATMDRGLITDNVIVNNGQTTGNPPPPGPFQSIRLESTNAAAGAVDWLVSRNICRSTETLKRQDSGFVQANSGGADAWANCWVYENYIKGYTGTIAVGPQCSVPAWGTNIATAQLDGGAAA